MEDKMNKLNDSELEQVTGGKSFAEWKAYIDSVSTKCTAERRILLQKALHEIKKDSLMDMDDSACLEQLIHSLLGDEILLFL